MTKATEIELDVHGLSDAGADGAYLALSPQAGGRFALTAQDVRATRLRGRPLVILGACDAAQGAAFAHEAWSLPIAFVTAGAAAVLAATVPIPDAEAEPLFAAIRRRVAAGATPAMAVRDTRVEFLQKDPRSFAAHVLAFQAVWE
jgi:CHAT domain-containing protein